MIEVQVREDPETGDKLITARVPKVDLVELKLTDFDRAVLAQPEENAADIFQSLELLARRQSEQLSVKDQRQKNG